MIITPKQRLEREKILNAAHHNHESGMKSYAFFKIHNNTSVEDLVQNTFIKTWSYLVRKGKIELMKPFLYHILNQLIIDEYRKKKTTSLDSMIEKGFEPGVDQTEDILKMSDSKRVLNLIQNLPPKYRKVLRMKYSQNLSLKEISSITGQSRNTIAVQAHRGLAKLKKLYNHT